MMGLGGRREPRFWAGERKHGRVPLEPRRRRNLERKTIHSRRKSVCIHYLPWCNKWLQNLAVSDHSATSVDSSGSGVHGPSVDWRCASAAGLTGAGSAFIMAACQARQSE